MKKTDVIIIGAGAAGLMCAIEAGKRGRNTLVLDHANKVGKKILMSGGGRCNFTNLTVGPENFISHNPHFCKSALSRYQPHHFITLVEKHAIAYHEKTKGQLFCDNKSKDIVNMLLDECTQAKVNIKLNTKIHSITANSSGYILDTSQGKFSCQSLVIATGGLSIPTMGATGFGYNLAKQFNLNIWPTRAALVPFTLHTHDKDRLSDLSGVALQACIKCNSIQFDDSLLITHRGLSGPAALQISSYWRAGDTLSINTAANMDLLSFLLQKKKEQSRQSLTNLLSQHIAKRFVYLLLTPHEQRSMLHQYSCDQIKNLCRRFTDFKIKPNNTEGYRTAEVTLGGVDCDEICSKTFASKKQQGLYFVGEVLDVTGWLGGYNFQWAWASGHAAGQVV
jgi:predicted Rossmann fold flavoprotein